MRLNRRRKNACGAGKSTTVGMLTTGVVPTADRAWAAGIDVAGRPADARWNIGAVPVRSSAAATSRAVGALLARDMAADVGRPRSGPATNVSAKTTPIAFALGICQKRFRGNVKAALAPYGPSDGS